MKEIEQKFLFSSIPDDLPGTRTHSLVFRKYISYEPEIRINKRVFDYGNERYHLCFKSEGNLTRDEIKIRITQKEFLALANLVQKGFMLIDITSIELEDGHVISFKNIERASVRFAEIEYRDDRDYEENHSAFERFSFFDGEVTYDEKYYVKNIWRDNDF